VREVKWLHTHLPGGGEEGNRTVGTRRSAAQGVQTCCNYIPTEVSVSGFDTGTAFYLQS
jgi:hypothetical protein